VLTAAILYLPANIYPVMTVTSLGHGEPDTIVSGIRRLFEEGMVPIALLVLFASVLVPLLKLLGLATLLVSVRRGSVWRPRDRTLLYRIIEGIGRWSMVDIFMIAILTSLVSMGNIALVEPEVGSIAFAAVVILTMLAAMSFDPRLIWDVIDERHGDGRAPGA
jgi:paraquat-inducible protein A